MMRIVDLSPEIVAGLAPMHTVAVTVEAEVHSKPIPPGTHWQGTSIKIYTHTGAHIDALIHVREGGWATDSIRLDQVIGQALVLDFSSKKHSEPIGVDELRVYEPTISPDDILLLRTDWVDKYYGTPTFFGESPYVTEEGAQWLLDRQPKLVGFDFTQDFCIRDREYDPRELYTHQLLLGHGIPIVEGLANLGALPMQGYFQFFAPFVKLRGSDGSLARAFALVDE
jgi:kynurenine formamidase